MLLYEFKCPMCAHIQEEWRRIKERNDPLFCDECATEMTRVITPPHFDYLHMGVDAAGMPTAADKWADMHEEAGRKRKDEGE